MLFNRILSLSRTGVSLKKWKLLGVCAVHNTNSLPLSSANTGCPGNKGTSAGSAQPVALKRAMKSGKCRMGFIPDEWFLFFHSKTGYSGPFVFGIVSANYLISKEIYIMEHEYYLGLSVFIIVYYVSTRFGPTIGASLDKEVDAYAENLEKGRKEEHAYYENLIKEGVASQNSANGQKLLMDAKKENVALQLEAEYRERLMTVYRMVKGRMDYHVKRYYAEARIHQKWMIDWILNNVNKSITPDFEQRALSQAIADLEALASRA